MKNAVQFYELKKVVWSLMITLLTFSAVLANSGMDAVKVSANSKQTMALLTANLTKKLKADLVTENLTLKLGNIEQAAFLRNEIKLKGSAVCVLPTEKTQLPIVFEAKINLARQVIDEIQYKFVESEFVPSTEEETLMKELMKQISRDYKTKDVVIAIDGFETYASSENKTGYKGTGEVRIGGFSWNKINFELILNKDKTVAERVLYKLQK